MSIPLISCSVRPISILLLVNPGYLFIAVAPARRCQGSFFFILPQSTAGQAQCQRYVSNMPSAKGLPSCHSLYTILSDPVSGYVSTYQRYYSSLSGCHAVVSALSKGVYKHPRVKRIATGSLYIESMCYPLPLVPLLLSFGGVRALSPPNLGADVDTIPGPARLGKKCRNPFCLPDFVSGGHARGTREIIMSCLETRHGAFYSTFRRRILRGG